MSDEPQADLLTPLDQASLSSPQAGDRFTLPNGAIVRIAHLSDFQPDQDNLNLHTQRGRGMLETELQADGFGRPMLASAEGVMLAGNMTHEVIGAINLGEGLVIVVETDGTTPIIHQRRDIAAQSDQGRGLATADNLIAARSLNIDPQALLKLKPQVRDRFFFADEVAEILNKDQAVIFKEYDESIADGVSVCECPTCGHKHAKKD
jgi:hypothetical protein